MKSFNFLAWRNIQNPDTTPYRPGAKHTQGFGLRITDIGSPLHLGNDRGREPRDILAPFDGRFEWDMLTPAGVAGSILRLIPHNGQDSIELQVFHSVDGAYTDHIEGECKRGEKLPVQAGDLGLSVGIHTHTELVIRDNPLSRQQMRMEDMIWLYRSGSFNVGHIWSHCKRHGLDYEDVIKRTSTQISTWDISYMSTRYAVRDMLPEYRLPHWGEGKTLHVDTLWSMDI